MILESVSSTTGLHSGSSESESEEEKPSEVRDSHLFICLEVNKILAIVMVAVAVAMATLIV